LLFTLPLEAPMLRAHARQDGKAVAGEVRVTCHHIFEGQHPAGEIAKLERGAEIAIDPERGDQFDRQKRQRAWPRDIEAHQYGLAGLGAASGRQRGGGQQARQPA
jgi:hypothetical protein